MNKNEWTVLSVNETIGWNWKELMKISIAIKTAESSRYFYETKNEERGRKGNRLAAQIASHSRIPVCIELHTVSLLKAEIARKI